MMQSFRAAAAALILFGASPVLAQTAINGTWKIDTNASDLPSTPSVYTAQDGQFGCSSCTYPYSVPADGKFHAVANNPYVDAISIRVVDGATIELAFRKGSVVIDQLTRKLAADGNSFEVRGVERSSSNGTTVEYSGVMTRVGAAPAKASHALAGTWQMMAPGSTSDAGITMIYQVSGNDFEYRSPTGERLKAAIGGAPAPFENDPAGTLGKVERIGAEGYRVTSLEKGKVVSVVDLTPAGDTMNAKFEDTLRSTTRNFVLRKQ